MNINRISYQPNFQAKFYANEAMINYTKKEVQKGNENELVIALNNLSKIQTNAVLGLGKNAKNYYTVTNFYNGQTMNFNNFDIDNIINLADPRSAEYKILFAPIYKKQTIGTINNKTNIISKRFFEHNIPDYSVERKVDKIV